MSTWITMLVAGIGTYLLRVSMVVAHTRYGLVDHLSRHLRFVGPSVIAAILAATMLESGQSHAAPAIGEIVAVVAAFVAVRRSGNVALALAVGFPIYWSAVAVGLG